ncbi:hypothetical protein ACXLPV_004498 [Vibrio parahaemolyticus]
MALNKLTQVGGSPARKIREEIATKVDEHASKRTNPHGVTKAQVGLGNVPNYPATSSVSDTSNSKLATAGAVKQAYDKGVEGLNRGNAAYDRAEQAETNANKHTDQRISTLIGGAPAEALDTIKELGDALMDQGDAVAAITTNIAQHKSDTSNPHKVTKAQVGLSNVPNYAFTAAVNDASDVKFAAAGAVKKAYDLAASKMTQAQADGRYLKLSGGTLTNALIIDEGSSNVSQLHLGHTGKRFHMEAKTDGSFSIVETDVSARLNILKGGQATLYGSLSTTESLSSNRSVEVQGTRAGNTVPTTDHVKLDGYGLIGNRQILYVTNGSTDDKAEVKIGVGGAHNSTAANLILNKSKVTSNVPIEIQGHKVITEAFNRTQVMAADLNIAKDSWFTLAKVVMPQSSSTAVIEIYGGSGFNVNSPYQTARHQIILRSSNNSPKGLTGICITDHHNGLPFSGFGWVNTGGDNYTIYAKSRSPYSVDVLISFMATHTITPYITNVGATQPTGITLGSIATSYNSYNKPLNNIQDSSTAANGVQILTASGSTEIGMRNGSYCHYSTSGSGGHYFYGHVHATNSLNALGEAQGQGLAYKGKTAIGGNNDGWLRINPFKQFSTGTYFGEQVVRCDGEYTCGSWGGSTMAARMDNSFHDSSWGSNGKAAFSVNNADTNSAHWALASYYDATNIRAGIQILSNSDGRMRFYTNRRSNYAEIYGGNVFAGSPQSQASNALTRKDYVDSKVASLTRCGEVVIGNSALRGDAGTVTFDGMIWGYKEWKDHCSDPFNLVDYLSAADGFKIKVAGYYEIEWTDLRRRNASGDSPVYAAIVKGKTTKLARTNSLTNDYDACPVTCRWVGKLAVNDTIQLYTAGASLSVEGGHFVIRYIKP